MHTRQRSISDICSDAGYCFLKLASGSSKVMMELLYVDSSELLLPSQPSFISLSFRAQKS
jgi:hypothetical protein